jgi:hypothetical protein
VACALRSDFRNRRGVVTDPSRVHVSAVVEAGGGAPAAAVEWSEPPGAWSRMSYDPEDALAIQRMIRHGPVFQCLQELCISRDKLWGRIVAPPLSELRPAAPEAGWLLPCAVLDACLQLCSTLTYLRGEHYLPQAVNTLRLGRLPAAAESCIVIACRREAGPDRTAFDFTLYDEHRQVLLDAQGYAAAIISTKKGAP